MRKNINSEKNRKNKKIFLIALIVLVIMILVIASFLIIPKIFNKSIDDTEVPNDISGAWELVKNPELIESTVDEADRENAYYVFDTPDKYGRGSYYTCYQGGIEYFKYELLEEDSVEKINLGTENMEYKITGSKADNNAKLTIIYPEYTDDMTGLKTEASEYVFVQADNPDYEKQNFEDYNVDNTLLGTWTNKERTLSYYQYTYTYEQSVEFKDNGIMIIHYKSEDLMLDRYIYYAYTADASKLTFSLVTDKDTKYTVAYGYDDSGNLKFTDDNTNNSIFADAFFGDFVFFLEENIPETTIVFTD